MGAAQNDQLLGLSASDIATEVAALASFCNSYRKRTVIGIDMMQESHAWLVLSSRGATIGAAVQDVTSIPISFSNPALAVGDLNTTTYRNTLRPYVDFWDYHTYYDMAATDLATYWSTETIPLLLGEFGQNVAAGGAAIQSRYNSVKTIANRTEAGGQRVAGALSWAITDQDTVTSNQWGMFDVTGVARTDASTIFATFPKT